MNAKMLLLAPVLALALGCQAAATAPPSAAPTPTPAPTPASGIEGLVADLAGTGSAAKSGSPFLGEPVGGEGRTVCVGTETVQVYQFIDHEAALAASARIDREDPSKVGNSIVDWAGRPRFWLRDRIIVLYLGQDAPTEAALRGVLGQPFAEGRDGRMPLPGQECQ